MSVQTYIESFGFKNVANIIAAASYHKVPLWFALAIAEMETTDGKMIYGHDYNTTFSTKPNPVTLNGITYPVGSNIPVTAENYSQYFGFVVNHGAPANGVGTYQITYAGGIMASGERSGGYLTQAVTLGYDLATSYGNAMMGNHILASHISSAKAAEMTGDDIYQYAAVLFNQGNAYTPVNWTTQSYGLGALAKLKVWRDRLANATTIPTPVPKPPVYMTATGDVNIRTGPSTQYRIVGVLKRGSTIKVTGTVTNGWRQVVFNENNRWISGSYLK